MTIDERVIAQCARLIGGGSTFSEHERLETVRDVISAYLASNRGKPAAWRFRQRGMTLWFHMETKPPLGLDGMKADEWEIEPLYTAPPAESAPKPLVWLGTEGGPGCDITARVNDKLSYLIRHVNEGDFDVIVKSDIGSGRLPVGGFSYSEIYKDTYAEAKSAAQADYEQRMRVA